MGRVIRRKGKRKDTLRQHKVVKKKPAEKQNSSRPITPNDTVLTGKCKSDPSQETWKQQIVPAIVSGAYLVVSTYITNVLNGISTLWGYVWFVSSLCVFLGYWIWRIVGRLFKHYHRVRLIQVLSMIIVVVLISVASPFYVDAFVKDQGSIEFPTFVDESTRCILIWVRAIVVFALQLPSHD